MIRHRLLLCLTLLLALYRPSFAEVKVSRNVNIIANEPIPQKQLEVDAQASPANPDHLFAGYINYQTGQEFTNERVTARARCGFSFSTNGGKTWKTSFINALNGNKAILDGILPTAAPEATVLKCGDPAITVDNLGNIYYFYLTELLDGQTTFMSVAKLTDPNDGSGNIIYQGQVLIDQGQAKGKVLDKGYIQWVPDPSSSDPKAPGFIYVCYSNFDGAQYSKSVCAISKDRGVTYTKPNQTKLNGPIGSGNGIALAPGPNGTAYLVFYAAAASEQNYYFLTVRPDGKASGNLTAILPPGYFPYEAPTGPDLARSPAFPTIVSDGNLWAGVFFSAYSKDGFSSPPSLVSSPHIWGTYTSNGGLTWTTPQVIDVGPLGKDNQHFAHQFQPRATYVGGIVSVFYYDGRNDTCWAPEPNPSSCGRALNPVYGGYFPSGRDRRFDTFVVQGRVNTTGTVDYVLPATQVSRYDVNGLTGKIQERNVAPNPCLDFRGKNTYCTGVNLFNLPATTRNGGSGFGGDYIAHAAKTLWHRNLPGVSPAWRHTRPGDSTTTLAWWTDFRRVALPLTGSVPDINGDWTQFVNAGAANCVNPMMKNTDVEFAEITESGLAASVKGSALRTGIPPDFTVSVWNHTGRFDSSGKPLPTFVRLTIEDNFPTEDWSFTQTLPSPSPIPVDNNSVDAKILNGSSVTLGVFYRWRSGVIDPPSRSVRIRVEEIISIGGSLVANGLTTSATYNVFTAAGTTTAPHKLTLSSKPKVSTFTSLTSQTSHSGFDDLGFDDLGFDDLGFDDLGFDDLGFTTLSDTASGALVPDKQVTFTVTGDGSTSTLGQSFTNVANGQQLLSNNWKFWVGIVQTQWNTNVNECTLIRTGTDVLLSSIPVTQPGTQNFQVSYDDLGFDDLGFDDLGFSTISEQFEDATFSLDKGERIKVVLRAFKPTNTTLTFNPEDDDQIGQAVFGPDDPTTGGVTEGFFDTTPPVILPIVTGTAGKNGWYRSTVTLDWSVKDAQSGILSYSAGCGNPATSDPETFVSETTGVTRTCSAVNRATDPAADHTSQESITIKIDKTKPNSPTATVSPAPNPQGWNNRLPVVVTFTSNGDTGAVQSGIDSCTAPVTFTQNTNGTFVTGTCTDIAGNVSNPVTVEVKIR